MQNFDATCRILHEPVTARSTSASLSNLLCSLCDPFGLHCDLPDIDTPFPFVLVISSKALQHVAAVTTSSTSASTGCGCAHNEIYDIYEVRFPQTFIFSTNEKRELSPVAVCLSFRSSSVSNFVFMFVDVR